MNRMIQMICNLQTSLTEHLAIFSNNFNLQTNLTENV